MSQNWYPVTGCTNVQTYNIERQQQPMNNSESVIEPRVESPDHTITMTDQQTYCQNLLLSCEEELRDIQNIFKEQSQQLRQRKQKLQKNEDLQVVNQIQDQDYFIDKQEEPQRKQSIVNKRYDNLEINSDNNLEFENNSPIKVQVQQKTNDDAQKQEKDQKPRQIIKLKIQGSQRLQNALKNKLNQLKLLGQQTKSLKNLFRNIHQNSKLALLSTRSGNVAISTERPIFMNPQFFKSAQNQAQAIKNPYSHPKELYLSLENPAAGPNELDQTPTNIVASQNCLSQNEESHVMNPRGLRSCAPVTSREQAARKFTAPNNQNGIPQQSFINESVKVDAFKMQKLNPKNIHLRNGDSVSASFNHLMNKSKPNLLKGCFLNQERVSLGKSGLDILKSHRSALAESSRVTQKCLLRQKSEQHNLGNNLRNEAQTKTEISQAKLNFDQFASQAQSKEQSDFQNFKYQNYRSQQLLAAPNRHIKYNKEESQQEISRDHSLYKNSMPDLDLSEQQKTEEQSGLVKAGKALIVKHQFDSSVVFMMRQGGDLEGEGQVEWEVAEDHIISRDLDQPEINQNNPTNSVEKFLTKSGVQVYRCRSQMPKSAKEQIGEKVESIKHLDLDGKKLFTSRFAKNYHLIGGKSQDQLLKSKPQLEYTARQKDQNIVQNYSSTRFMDPKSNQSSGGTTAIQNKQKVIGAIGAEIRDDYYSCLTQRGCKQQTFNQGKLLHFSPATHHTGSDANFKVNQNTKQIQVFLHSLVSKACEQILVLSEQLHFIKKDTQKELKKIDKKLQKNLGLIQPSNNELDNQISDETSEDDEDNFKTTNPLYCQNCIHFQQRLNSNDQLNSAEKYQKQFCQKIPFKLRQTGSCNSFSSSFILTSGATNIPHKNVLINNFRAHANTDLNQRPRIYNKVERYHPYQAQIIYNQFQNDGPMSQPTNEIFRDILYNQETQVDQQIKTNQANKFLQGLTSGQSRLACNETPFMTINNESDAHLFSRGQNQILAQLNSIQSLNKGPESSGLESGMPDWFQNLQNQVQFTYQNNRLVGGTQQQILNDGLGFGGLGSLGEEPNELSFNNSSSATFLNNTTSDQFQGNICGEIIIESNQKSERKVFQSFQPNFFHKKTNNQLATDKKGTSLTSQQKNSSRQMSSAHWTPIGQIVGPQLFQFGKLAAYQNQSSTGKIQGSTGTKNSMTKVKELLEQGANIQGQVLFSESSKNKFGHKQKKSEQTKAKNQKNAKQSSLNFDSDKLSDLYKNLDRISPVLSCSPETQQKYNLKNIQNNLISQQHQKIVSLGQEETFKALYNKNVHQKQDIMQLKDFSDKNNSRSRQTYNLTKDQSDQIQLVTLSTVLPTDQASNFILIGKQNENENLHPLQNRIINKEPKPNKKSKKSLKNMSTSSKKRSKVQMLLSLPTMQGVVIGNISSKSPNKKLSVIELQKKIKKVQVPQLNLGKILGKQNNDNYKSQFLMKPPSFSAQSGAIICQQDVQLINSKNMKNNLPFGNSQSAQLSVRKFDSQITQDQYQSRNNFVALKVSDPKQSSHFECTSGAFTIFNLPFSPITAIKKQEIMSKQAEDKENISSTINQDFSNKTRRQQSEPSRKTYDETEENKEKVNLKIKIMETLLDEGDNKIIKNQKKNVSQMTEKQNNNIQIEVNQNKKEQTEKTIRGRNPKFFDTERMLLENCQLASASSQLQLKATKLLSGQLLSVVQSSQNFKQSALPQKKQSKAAIMSDPVTRSLEREPSKGKDTRQQSKDSALGRFRRGIQENNSANYKIQNYHLAERSESNKNQKGGSAKPEENQRKVKNVSALPMQKQKLKMSQLNFILQGPQGTMAVDFKGKPLTLAPSSLPLKTERIQKDGNQNNLQQHFTVDVLKRNQEESEQLNNHFQTNFDPSFLEIANNKIRRKDQVSEDHFTQGSLLNQIISPNSEEYEQQEKKSSEERNTQQTMKSKNTRTSFQNLISIFKQASSLMKPKAKSARPCQKKQKKEANSFKPSETAPPFFQEAIKAEPNFKIVNIQTCKIDKAITGSSLQLQLGFTSNQTSDKFQELSEIAQLIESQNINNTETLEKLKTPLTICNSQKKKKEVLRQSSKKGKDQIQQSANKNKDKAIKLFHESKPKQKDETLEQEQQQDSAVQAYGISVKPKNQQASITKKRSLALLDLSNDLVQLNKEILQQKLTNFGKNSFGSSGCATTTAKQTNCLNAIFSSRQLKKSFQPNEYQGNKKQQSSNSSKAAEIDNQQIDKNGVTPRTVNINVIHKQSPKQKVIKIRKDQLILKK